MNIALNCLKGFNLVPNLYLVVNLNAGGQFHIGELLMAKNNLQNSLKLLLLMYR